MRSRAAVTIALACAVVWLAPGLAQQTAEQLYQTGLYQEEVTGDLQQAIRIYERILADHGANRVAAAKAQLHVGICQEMLGLQEARRAYQRVLDDYGDQADVVSQARARLAALSPDAEQTEGPVARMLLKAERGCLISEANPSPDGTRVAYSDQCNGGAIYVRDLRSGETRRVTAPGVYAATRAVWSPDGSRIAVADLNAGLDGFPTPLQIIDLESGDVEMPAGLEDMWRVYDWSPDGEWLSGKLGNDEVAFSLSTGRAITFVSNSEGGLRRPVFSPDSRFVAFSDLGDRDPDIWVMELATREKHRITTDPGPERGAQWSPDGRTIAYRGENGLWAIGIANGRAEGQPRLLRTDTGALAAWTEHGAYYYSGGRLVSAYRIPVDPATAEPTGDPERMPELDDFEWFAWSPDMQQIAGVPPLGGDWQHMLLMRGGSVTTLPFGGIYQLTTLWWTPDGSEIQFTYRTYNQSDQRKTVLALDPANGNARELFPRRDSIHHIHVSPDGTHMVFLRGPGAVGGPNELVVSGLDDPDGGRVLASETDPEGQFWLHYGLPAFSPDGSQIAFVRQDRGLDATEPVGLYVIPSDGSGPARLITTVPLIARATWDPSGRFIAFLERDYAAQTGTISVVSVETGSKRQLLPPGPMSEAHRLRTWSPDGKWIVFSRQIGNSEFWVTDDLLGEGGGGR
jgi:Tol biopolymer transport system component